VTITSSTLFRGAGVAAVAAGVIFIGVQINHAHLDATSSTTSDAMTPQFPKGPDGRTGPRRHTGTYLRQVTKLGLLGLPGYVVFASGYFSVLGTVRCGTCSPFHRSQFNRVRECVIAFANNGLRPATSGAARRRSVHWHHLRGWRLHFRHRTLRSQRWAAALLALGTLATIPAGIVPQPERLFALPTGLPSSALATPYSVRTFTIIPCRARYANLRPFGGRP
jgi:hypothetical protein